MKARIDLISIIAVEPYKLADFYRDILGFKTKTVMGDYTEFEMEGVRFSICGQQTMVDATGSDVYAQPRGAMNFELAFPVDTPAEVDVVYADLVAKGAQPITAPADMPWGQRTAFFADPEGNIHEIFANLGT